MFIPVIMAGGAGTRLWPLSRSKSPKQFLNLIDNFSVLQSTLLRLQPLEHAAPLVVTNDDYRFIVAEQLREIGYNTGSIILEPAARNTAPAIALAAMQAQATGDDPFLLVLPSDHLITDETAFHSAIAQAIDAAADDKIVTFGIQPTEPATGYGYIRASITKNGPCSIKSFVEKPDLISAQSYLDSGDYFWNSGMFLVRASCYLGELAKYRPSIYAACAHVMEKATKSDIFLRLDAKLFNDCPNESVDKAVMENTRRSVMVPLNAGWRDIGSWQALWDIDSKCCRGNARHGDVLLEDTHDSLVYSTHRLVATVGVKNLIVVETKDAVLVAQRDLTQNVQKIVERLKKDARKESEFQREVYRPWGKFDILETGQCYQVKRIVLKPGAKISLQMHHHRAEHWVVVSGIAKVTRGEDVFILKENQSTYIPLGETHCLENLGKVDLEVIEVQSGNYLSEDDIVRFEDQYGRV